MDKQADRHIPFDKSVVAKVMLIILFLGLPLLLQKDAKSLMPLVFLVPGICFLVWGCWIIYLSKISKDWPVTHGSIIENTIREISRPGSPGRTTYSYPALAYRYSANGIEYISRRIVLFASDLEYPGQAEEPARFCSRYPVGSLVDIYYSPRHPGNGVLIVGALSRSKQHSVVFLIAGCFLTSMGIFLFYIDIAMR